MNDNFPHVGIAGIGYDIPAGRLSSERMADMSGIPVTVLTEKIGMQRKALADADDHPTRMAVRAARQALDRAQMDPSEVDLVIYCGGSPQDYGLGFPAATIQASLGVMKAQAFEIRNSCNGSNLALHICKSLLMADPTLQTGLVVCAEKWSTILDYTDPQNLPLFILADGAAAAVVSKYVTTNRLLAHEGITDGRFAEHIIVRQGGTRHPAGPIGPQSFLRAENHEDYAAILETVYLSNYAQVIQRAVEKSGFTGRYSFCHPQSEFREADSGNSGNHGMDAGSDLVVVGGKRPSRVGGCFVLSGKGHGVRTNRTRQPGGSGQQCPGFHLGSQCSAVSLMDIDIYVGATPCGCPRESQ
jgi:3-oxoacyl-[acyl-carrier-protein] synthase-3